MRLGLPKLSRIALLGVGLVIVVALSHPQHAVDRSQIPTAALAANLSSPTGVAVNGAGDLIIADMVNHRIRKVDRRTGGIRTVAGDGVDAHDGGSTTALKASLQQPYGVAIDGADNLYIVEAEGNRVQMVDARTGIIGTVAGSGFGGGGFLGEGVESTQARLDSPESVAVDVDGNIYVADTANNRVRKVDAHTHVIRTVAGNGTGVFSDGAGHLYGSYEEYCREHGTAGVELARCRKYEGAALDIEVSGPSGIAVDQTGNLYIAQDGGHRVIKVAAATGMATVVAGNGQPGYRGDGGPAVNAQLNSPRGIAVDHSGQLYITDTFNHCIRKVDAQTGIITTIAGTGWAGHRGDGGPAKSARLNIPTGNVAIDQSGNIYIADTGNHRIRQIVAGTGVIGTVAGSGVEGYSGDAAEQRVDR
ncbi:hypothetical protein [Dyella amyloliquefaciens]|uniref:NHL domain-containing protein n=1 Tax=Dyella amyloliquefaciens TaxID=1770545 RepID=UPI0013EE5E28|nr:hypothetical protein [Dyella amyloliquefaciens]